MRSRFAATCAACLMAGLLILGFVGLQLISRGPEADAPPTDEPVVTYETKLLP